MANIRDFVYQLSPPWLRARYGERFMGMMGLMGDLMMEGVSQALRAPRFTSGFQPPDALELLGDERSMPRYPAETDAAYRTRLRAAWDAYEQAGNEESIESQLKLALGLTNVEVVPVPTANRGGWVPKEDTDNGVASPVATLTANFEYEESDATFGMSRIILAGGDVDLRLLLANADIRPPSLRKVLISGTASNDGYYHMWDAISGFGKNSIYLEDLPGGAKPLVDEGPVSSTIDFTHWSRFSVIISLPHPWVTPTYGSGLVYGLGDNFSTYGSTLTQGEVNTIKRIISKWKDSESICSEIVIVLSDGNYYGKVGLVYGGAGLVYGGTAPDLIRIPFQSSY